MEKMSLNIWPKNDTKKTPSGKSCKEKEISLVLQLVTSSKCDMFLDIRRCGQSVEKTGINILQLSETCSSICPIIWEKVLYSRMVKIHDSLIQSLHSTEETGLPISTPSSIANTLVMSGLVDSENGSHLSCEMSSKAKQLDSHEKPSICSQPIRQSTAKTSIER